MNSDALAEAITDTLISPNENDRKKEPANVVDGLFAIARAIDRLAAAVEGAPVDAGARTPKGGAG